jgi:hypothetical protein
MDVDFFEILCFIAFGVANFGIFCVRMGWILRSTICQQDDYAKGACLRVIEDADKRERRPHRREERIRTMNDQTQRGDAS